MCLKENSPTSVTLVVCPSYETRALAFWLLISNSRTCGFPAAARNCLSGVIFRQFTCESVFYWGTFRVRVVVAKTNLACTALWRCRHRWCAEVVPICTAHAADNTINTILWVPPLRTTLPSIHAHRWPTARYRSTQLNPTQSCQNCIARRGISFGNLNLSLIHSRAGFR